MIMHHVQGAIVTMTKALAKDLIKKKGIRVNAGMLTALQLSCFGACESVFLSDHRALRWPIGMLCLPLVKLSRL